MLLPTIKSFTESGCEKRFVIALPSDPMLAMATKIVAIVTMKKPRNSNSFPSPPEDAVTNAETMKIAGSARSLCISLLLTSPRRSFFPMASSTQTKESE